MRQVLQGLQGRTGSAGSTSPRLPNLTLQNLTLEPLQNLQNLRNLFSFLAVILASAFVVSCNRAPTAADLDRDNPIRATPPVPFGMEDFFDQPPPSPVRVRLGRWLFFDQRLSADLTVSCATCHRPEHAFSQPTAVSIGVDGHKGRRKAPSLINLASRTELPDTPANERGPLFFWDGRATSLEAQVLMPIADPNEMGLDHRSMIERLSRFVRFDPVRAISRRAW